ncbi:MAG: helix-turn-helix transcriptional regulator [Salibacteraceae bacterium]
MSKPRKYSSPALKRVKARINPELRATVKKRMQLAVKIDEARKAKGLSKSELATEMGSNNPSEATKWLSGTHNFTIETLFKLEQVLGVSLVNCDMGKTETFHVEIIAGMENEGPSLQLKRMLSGMENSVFMNYGNVTANA